MNVEAQRISPAPIRKSLRVKAEPGEGVRHFRRQHGRLVDEDRTACSARRRRTWSSSRAPAAAGTRSAMTAASRTGARSSPGTRPSASLLAWQLNAEWAYDPDFETTVEVRFTADGDHTIVDFEHRDLDRFGDNAEAVRGDYDTGMDGGWRELLAGYQRLAEA